MAGRCLKGIGLVLIFCVLGCSSSPSPEKPKEEKSAATAVVESFDATITAIPESWPSKVSLKKSCGCKVAIMVNDTTVITRKGSPADFNALKEGQSVRITPAQKDSNTAAKIDILEG